MLRIDTRTASLLLALSLAFGGPTAAIAQGSPSRTTTTQTPADEILTTLRVHGYQIVENERTWLGRQRVIAEKNGARRELVFNPGTGEILRDYAIKIAPSAATRLSRDASRAGTGGGTGVAASADSAPGLSVGESLGMGRAGDVGVVGGDSVE